MQRDRYRERSVAVAVAVTGGLFTFANLPRACLRCAALRCAALAGVAWPAWWPEPWRVLLCMLARLHGGSAVQCRGGTLQRGCGKARSLASPCGMVLCTVVAVQSVPRVMLISLPGSASHCNGVTTRGRRLRDLEGPDLEPILTD